MAQSGNGVDIGTIYQLLTQVSARLDSMESLLDQLLAVVTDHSRILADHGRQLDDLAAGMASLRSDVSHYHQAVISQGMHYSELEGRVLRIERHLNLESSSG